jgi:hypothetical protein
MGIKRTKKQGERARGRRRVIDTAARESQQPDIIKHS